MDELGTILLWKLNDIFEYATKNALDKNVLDVQFAGDAIWKNI